MFALGTDARIAVTLPTGYNSRSIQRSHRFGKWPRRTGFTPWVRRARRQRSPERGLRSGV